MTFSGLAPPPTATNSNCNSTNLTARAGARFPRRSIDGSARDAHTISTFPCEITDVRLLSVHHPISRIIKDFRGLFFNS